MNIIYTKLSKEHLDSIAALDKLCFTLCWSRALFESELSNINAHYTVAICDGKVVGYVGIVCVAGEGSITNIAVHPDYRNHGIATCLLDMILNFADENELEFVTLEVRESNINAIHLYEKFGFETVGKRKNYYSDNHETALLMTKYTIHQST